MLILPAIDLRAGKCVRLWQGDFDRETIYGDDPVALARDFERQGAEWLHVVDLDGARAGESKHLEQLRAIRGATGLRIQFGGGLRTLEAARAAFEAGAERVVLGSVLLRDPELGSRLLVELGSRAVGMLDARDGVVAAQGWTVSGNMSLVEAIVSVREMGAQRIAVTDIGRDGTLEGPNVKMLASIVRTAGVPVLASGGVARLEDLHALAAVGAEGAIVGKALYEGCFDLTSAISVVMGPRA